MLQDQVTFRPKSSGQPLHSLESQVSSDAAGPPAKFLKLLFLESSDARPRSFAIGVRSTRHATFVSKFPRGVHPDAGGADRR